MNKKSKIAILASGGGSNAEEIIKYFQHHPSIEVVLVLSNNPDAFVLERVKKLGVTAKVFNKQEFQQSEIFLRWLKELQVSHIVLAGFLWLIPEYLINAFERRIVNIHPAILPKFGGKGMYGMKVHQAVKASGETETGITIHLVNEKYDDGQILFQARCILTETDTPEQIAKKVHQLEHASYPKVIEKWIGT